MTSQPTSTDSRPDPALPPWISEKLIAETCETWSPHYGRSLTVAEAVEILRAFGRLLDAMEA
jgi:hypothetical protein